MIVLFKIEHIALKCIIVSEYVSRTWRPEGVQRHLIPSLNRFLFYKEM